jgi:hypothetical protein
MKEEFIEGSGGGVDFVAPWESQLAHFRWVTAARSRKTACERATCPSFAHLVPAVGSGGPGSRIHAGPASQSCWWDSAAGATLPNGWFGQAERTSARRPA